MKKRFATFLLMTAFLAAAVHSTVAAVVCDTATPAKASCCAATGPTKDCCAPQQKPDCPVLKTVHVDPALAPTESLQLSVVWVASPLMAEDASISVLSHAAPELNLALPPPPDFLTASLLRAPPALA